jgi:large subunit ribosomal protein L3
MAGRLGADNVTKINLEVVKIDAERNLLLVKGAIPGSENGQVVVRPAVKAAVAKAAPAAPKADKSAPKADKAAPKADKAAAPKADKAAPKAAK